MGQRGGPIGSSSAASTVPGWRADEFTQFLTDFLEQGVVQGVGGELAVSERAAGANMSVDVAIGRALIEVTPTLLAVNKTHKTWFYNDAIENVSVPTADGTYERIDRIVAKFDMTVDPDGSAGNIVSIELVEGTPAGSPSAPATPSNAISLATISVPAGDTTISDAQITDTRTYITVDTGVLADVTRVSDMASTANGKGASLVGVEDSGGNFTATDVEAVLAELYTTVAGIIPAPRGAMVMWTTDSAPTGWLLCYGQGVSLTTYEDLYDLITTTFGAVGSISGGVAAAAFTADDATDTFTSSTHGLSDGDVVVLTTSGSLPTGLSTATKYYVVNKTTNTFQLEASVGGGAIDITSTGSGTHTFNPGFTLPDMRGRFPLGQDDMGGSSANRVTDTEADTVGSSEGVESIDLNHDHGALVRTGDPGGAAQYAFSSSDMPNALSSTQGIMNPYLTLNYIIKH